MDTDVHPAGTCLLVLMGLPGAGKTTLARLLCRHVAGHGATDGQNLPAIWKRLTARVIMRMLVQLWRCVCHVYDHVSPSIESQSRRWNQHPSHHIVTFCYGFVITDDPIDVAHICFDDYSSPPSAFAPDGAIPTRSTTPGKSDMNDSSSTSDEAPGGESEPELSHHFDDDQSQDFDPLAWKVGNTPLFAMKREGGWWVKGLKLCSKGVGAVLVRRKMGIVTKGGGMRGWTLLNLTLLWINYDQVLAYHTH